MTNTKDKLRMIAKYNRSVISNRSKKDCLIREKVLELLRIQKVRSLFIYVSFGSEVDTHGIIANLFDNTDIYVPHTFNGNMYPVKLDNVDRLSNVDMHGNVYSGNDLQTNIFFSNNKIEYNNVDATITPMLAFNNELYRLGYGGGFYDKFFATFDTMKIGIAYDEQINTDFVQESHDIPLDVIITQNNILRRS